ncbi:MAG: sulfotransferase [Lachnospiraceae bacterium]|nr:sulfotransferase [Lachnospiraceae bacterium]
MKIVSSTGYGFTGSTAITDLIKEYSGVETCKYSGYELKFFHDTKGVLNLHHYLVNDRTPAAMNDAALDYYKKCMGWAASGKSMNYELFFNGRFTECTTRYLEALGGDRFMDVHDLDNLTRIESLVSRVVNKLNAIRHSLTYKEEYGQKHIRPIPLFAKTKRNYLYDVSEDEFVELTRRYFSELLGAFTDKPVANIHELVPISLIDTCCRFFDDIYIITTERDPRDIYLNAKYRWLTLDHPSEDVVFFCEHYKWLRSLIPRTEKKEVIKIQFEDLVYKYEDTVDRIERFLGLDPADHIDARKYFNPEKARLNCNLVSEYKDEKKNLEYIEKELTDWLFDFDAVGAD